MQLSETSSYFNIKSYLAYNFKEILVTVPILVMYFYTMPYYCSPIEKALNFIGPQ